MKPQKIKFIEQYIDEEPTDLHSWRGISCYVNEESVFFMSYLPKKREYSEPTHFEMDTTLGSPGSDFRRKIYGKTLRTKEEAKEFAQKMFNEYVYSLCMDEPNPDGGVTTAELALELGASMDKALDIHNEVERLANPLAFANWLSKNYNIENGIGYWSDYTDDDTQYTTEELWNKFNRQIKDEKET